MLTKNEAEKILTLQQKAYDLFIWIQESVKWGKLQFNEKHLDVDSETVMRRWILRNQGSFPENIKINEVNEADMTAFVNLALSFPKVSFEPVAGGELIAGCDCGFCAVYSRSHFKAKNVTSKDNDRADRAIQLSIQTVSEEMNLNLNLDQVSQFQKKYPELQRQATTIAYVQDLERRTRLEVQNSTGLVLWRRLKRKPKVPHSVYAGLMRRRLLNAPKFKVTADDYTQALEDLKNKLGEFAKRLNKD